LDTCQQVCDTPARINFGCPRQDIVSLRT
jgi:hypothetical protein